jgi:tryptophan halogenase
MIQRVLVLGAGSAGLLAAISLKRKIPRLSVTIVRSRELGVIGVGESTTPGLPRHLFNYLGIRRKQFYALAEPTWKMGIHFLWGPRPFFNYGFSQQLDAQWSDLPRPHGFYCDDDFTDVDMCTALMRQGKAFERQPNNGGPVIPDWHAFHLDNPKLVKALEVVAKELGIEFIDANVAGAQRSGEGIASIALEDGRKLEADFFIDASGFRSELLSRTLEEPFVSFAPSLFCDRAIVGNWQRTDEPILPYTTAETMNAGWCWRIEHEQTVNRGYVYCSDSISDEEARNEFLAKNPRAKTWDHVVKFRSGRYRRGWVGNVMAIGNAGGFVEPLEATALMVVSYQCQTFVDMLLHSGAAPTPTMQALFNHSWAATWDEIRDFLTLHYYANKRLDTPFWRHCQHDTDVSRLTPLLKFYDENGPTGFARHLLGNTGSQFGIEGFLVILVGTKFPYRGRHTPTEAEWQTWNRHRADYGNRAQSGMDVKEALSFIKHPLWTWHGEA